MSTTRRSATVLFGEKWMRAWRRLGPAVVSVLAAMTIGRAQPVVTSKPAWLSDFASAQAAARLSGKPIFAVLH
jgi:hypothetical protein